MPSRMAAAAGFTPLSYHSFNYFCTDRQRKAACRQQTWRGHITKAGSGPVRTALIEAAWAYRYSPAIGVTLRRRQEGAGPDTLARSWKAQRRLHGKYRQMTARGKAAPEAATAVARELAGFLWAEMTS